MAVEFYIHKMSEHMDSAEIIQWLVAEGDAVAEHQALIEVMTDKFAVELEAPCAGILSGIRPGCVKGAIVPVGEAIAYIVQKGETAPKLPPFGAVLGAHGAASGADAAETEPLAEPVAAAANGDAQRIGRVKSTPVARRMAKDLAVDIEQVRGTGPGGRVTEVDIRAFVAAGSAPSAPAPVTPAPAAPSPAAPSPAAPSPAAPSPAAIPPAVPAPLPAAPAPTVRVPAPASAPVPSAPGTNGFRLQDLTPIQRITGERMRESVVNAPQFALDISADATNLLWLQEALSDRVTLQARARLSLTGLLVKIVAETLLRHPLANAQFAEGKIKLLDEINVGVAVGTDQGLVVPVVKGAARKELSAITAELASFQEKARTLHFTQDDLSGGTFTISNLGMYGVERFAAIVNPPQSAILAVGAVTRQPVALANDVVGVRPLMNLTLTVDHRVLDGLQAARFLAELKQKIEKPYSVID
jgi:pyruvate dehydrogenase E2 component (dihydrolipoamide acetyltransferase)